MRTKLLLLVLLSVLSCKCKMKDKTLENSNLEKAQTEMQNTVISKGNLYGSGEEGIEAENFVISSQEDWVSLIGKMNSVNNVSDKFLETKIDFSEFTIIAVFDSVKSNGGHSIDLDISQSTQNTIVKINKTAPSGMATTVMTQPYCIVKIPKPDLSVVFKE